MRHRNLLFLGAIALFSFVMKRDIAATTWDGCYEEQNGTLVCSFHNGAGETSCADMNAACANFCWPADYSSGGYECTDDGGDPPNHGYCLCFPCQVPYQCCGVDDPDCTNPYAYHCCNWSGDVCQSDSYGVKTCCPVSGC